MATVEAIFLLLFCFFPLSQAFRFGVAVCFSMKGCHCVRHKSFPNWRLTSCSHYYHGSLRNNSRQFLVCPLELWTLKLWVRGVLLLLGLLREILWGRGWQLTCKRDILAGGHLPRKTDFRWRGELSLKSGVSILRKLRWQRHFLSSWRDTRLREKNKNS